MTARVVGLDLSLTAAGVAGHDGETDTLTTKLKGCERLAWLADRVGAVVGAAADHAVGGAWPLVVIENYAYSRGNQAHQIGELGGVIRLALHEAGVPWVAVGTGQLKQYATGKGNADKSAMILAAYKRGGVEFTDDNQCDAWWLRAMGLDHLGCPPVTMPAANRQALDKVAWPEMAA